MNLYLLRHGLAVERGAYGCRHDADRPLTPKGKRRVLRITEAMQGLEVSLDLIVSSPYLRARQTASIVAGAFKVRKQLELTDFLKPDGDGKALVRVLRRRRPAPESVLLVGHEPYLSGLISRLLSGRPNLPVELKKGGLCKLTTESLKYGRCATLEWLLTPRQMTAMF